MKWTPEQLRQMFPNAAQSLFDANCERQENPGLNPHPVVQDSLTTVDKNPIWKMSPRERFKEGLKGHPLMNDQNTTHQAYTEARLPLLGAPICPPKIQKGVRMAEIQIQRDFLSWLEHHRDRLYWIAVRPDKKSTVRPGHPDVSIWGRQSVVGAGGRIGQGNASSLLIEFKTPEPTSKLSEDQREVHAWIESIRAVNVVVCRSSLEAIEAIRSHFGI